MDIGKKNAIVEMTQIEKRFGYIQALDKMDFSAFA